MSTSPREAWRDLGAVSAPTLGEFRVLPAGASSVIGEALFAIDAQGLHHLLIPAKPDAIESDQRSSGVHLVGRVLIDDDVALTYADIVCRKAHLTEVFDHLLEEVLLDLRRDPGRPATVARRVLNRWRELLDRERPGLLSTAQIIGLFGELMILERLSTQSPTAINAWTGPNGARFDFQRRSMALEVKTTSALSRTVVHVHGVDQLDPPPQVQLFMAVVSIEEQAAGTSLPELARRIGTQGVDALAFAAKLLAAGYSSGDEQHYVGIKFRVRSIRMFSVDDSFPKLSRSSFVSGDLPSRIGELQYAIDLTSAPPEALDDAMVMRLINELIVDV